MAKKGTTGVPTRSKRTADHEDRRTYLSRAEREARAQRWVLIGAATAIGVILTILLVGIVYEALIYPNQQIAVVNGDAITTSQFAQRVRYERWTSASLLRNVASLYGVQALTDQNSPFYQNYVELQPGREFILGRRVRDDMVNEILIRQQAADRGITATSEEVDAKIQEAFGYDPEAGDTIPTATVEPTSTPTPIVSPTPSPVPTERPTPEQTLEPTVTPMPTFTPEPTLTTEELAQRYEELSTSYFDEVMAASGMSMAQIRAIYEVQVLQEKLQEVVTADIPTSEEQVNARHILVATEQDAQDVMAALQAGEPFEELARSASTDTGSGSSGGELGWAGRGRFVPEFEDAVFNAELGQIVGPVQSQFGYHIIQVHAREVRDLTEAELTEKRQTAFNEWLQGLQGAGITYPTDFIDRTPSDPSLLELGLAGVAR